MRCRAKVAFTTVHGKIAVGTIVNIPDNLLEKYKDRVEPVSVSMPSGPKFSLFSSSQLNASLTQRFPVKATHYGIYVW